MMISTSARSARPGVRNRPNGVSVAKFSHHPVDDVDVGEEHRRLLVDRVVVDVVGRALLHDPALAHQRDPVGHAHRLLGLVGDEQHRRPLLLEDVERLVADAVAQPVVEAGERLVHQQDRRPRRQRPRQRHPLLLAARELVRVLVAVPRQPDPRRAAPAPARPAPAAGPLRPKATFSATRQVREEREVLEHQPDRRGPRAARGARASETDAAVDRAPCPRPAARPRRRCAAASTCRSPTARAGRSPRRRAARATRRRAPARRRRRGRCRSSASRTPCRVRREILHRRPLIRSNSSGSQQRRPPGFKPRPTAGGRCLTGMAAYRVYAALTAAPVSPENTPH